VPALPALASPADLAARLGRTLTDAEQDQAAVLLADASAMVRAYTRQDFTLTADDVMVLRGQGDTIKLPQRPVVDVTRVVAVGGNDALPDIALTDWAWDGLDLIRLGCGDYVINLPEVWWDDEDGYPGTYRVTNSHGYAAVPPAVLTVVCGVVTRVLQNPQNLRSETVGPYSVTYSIPATGEALGLNLSRYDKQILDDYRAKVGQIKVRPG
jgi:hypothetical protein